MRPRAFSLIRSEPHYRRDAIAAGLTAAGYEVNGHPRIGTPKRDDVLVIWNRYGHYDALARQFDAAGARVICVENGPFGRDWQGQAWYAFTLKNPLAGGQWPDGGPARWASFAVTPCEWRKGGLEAIVLAQRGIGPPGVAQPNGWHLRAKQWVEAAHGIPVRIREHPGERPCTPLDMDLASAAFVITWASGAALKAMLWGIPVVYGYEEWIAASCGTKLGYDFSPRTPLIPPETVRLAFFNRLSWAMWRIPEIESGAPFRHLLESPSTRFPATTAAI